jgi:translation initiation factor 2A
MNFTKFPRFPARLTQVTWRPSLSAVGKINPLTEPEIHPSAAHQQTSNESLPATPKPTGAYRPPHARGTLTPAAFKREDEAPQNEPATNGNTRNVPGLNLPDQKDEKKPRSRKKKEKPPPAPVPAEVPAEQNPVNCVPESTVSSEDLKKQRALLKKLRAIEELKLRQAGGEKLEKTQEQKIEKEMEIVMELQKLGFADL